MAHQSQSDESITDLDVSTSSLSRHDEEDSEQQSGVVNLLLHNVVGDQRKLIPGRYN